MNSAMARHSAAECCPLLKMGQTATSSARPGHCIPCSAPWWQSLRAIVIVRCEQAGTNNLVHALPGVQGQRQPLPAAPPAGRRIRAHQAT